MQLLMLLRKKWIYSVQAIEPKGSVSMDQFDFILKDFVNWKLDNVEVLEQFKHHDSLIYDRLEPVYMVLNHIYDDVVEANDINEEYQTIFQVGLNYLHSQFEVIRIYYEKLFDSNCERFEAYTPLVGYLLFISDLRADLEEIEDNIDFSELNEVETLLENMIAEQRDEFEYAANRLNKATHNIVKNLDFHYVSVVDIFVEIADTLDVELSTKEPLIIGREI